MQTFLLTWNPDKWSWDTLDADYDRARKQGFLDDSWSSGRSHRLRRGDRVFLLRQAREPRGILASGVVTSDEPYEGKHYSEANDTAIYVDTRFDVLLHPGREPILPRARLSEPPLDAVHWNTQSSGITIPPEAAAALENIWHDFLLSRGYSPIRFAEEIATPERFWEGALRRTTINAYERDPAARKACIAHFGSACRACGFDFAARFGELGAGYIHVHHTRPLSEARRGYAVDPIKDLVPVCPNCHAMLHQRTPPLSMGDLRKHIRNGTNDT
ncbi:MAG TPA: HNH endonuclease [Candidatus Udaeobacter sp.]